MSSLHLKMRTAYSLYGVGASVINDVIMIEADGGWRHLTENEEAEISKALLTTQKEDVTEKLLDSLSHIRARLAEHADQYQLAAWNDKSQRAQRIIANTASETDITILQTECDKRGAQETPQELARKQIAKGEALATAAATIDGMESAALKAIQSKRNANTLKALLEQLLSQAEAELLRLSGATP